MKPLRLASGAGQAPLPGLTEGRLIGGGPKLMMAEWVALIHLQQTFASDRRMLNTALERASERLQAEAAKTGRPRPGTRLRSPAGLARRLTVVRALAAGQLEGLPSEAIAAWNMFATTPEDARATAVELLGLDAVVTGSGPAAVAMPARGPEPSFGTFISEREDGATVVYVMQLVGRAVARLEGAANETAFVKVGRSNDPERRADELNCGFPPGCGLEWRHAADREFPSADAAHAFEQSVLATLHGRGLCIGGEYARVRSDLIRCLLDEDVPPAR